ncbi:hypothetical protein IM660_14155 [Ruania alkalisoli]|uniref:4-amino-4-deoxy-L-arabinose transferase-like glycosyltransferase n=1 Tax=Ruania alkalisoli TaxID=2779775 RepID=A0A7M1SQG3_9MICO|nr:DUF6541 family protein [Ruania alkalisoli]QOR69796.1 hypothetical protein IM660_14155 [Ruania alkalisoli]
MIVLTVLWSLAAFTFGALLLYVPGTLALRLVGVRGLSLFAAAPAVTFAIYGVAAIAAGALGLRWGLLAAAGGTIAAIGAALGMRALNAIQPRTDTPQPGRIGVMVWAALLAGVLLTLIPVWVGAGAPQHVLQRWDAVFHLGALRLIDETGSASSLTLGALSYGSGEAAVYPAAWHAFAALIPASTPTAVLTLCASLTSALPWVVGLVALVRELAPGSRPAMAGVAVAAGLVTASPTTLWVGWGHVPNAAALAMVPGVLALALRWLVRDRPRSTNATAGAVVVLLIAAAGLGLTHPNATLALAALLLPAGVWALGRGVRHWWGQGRRGVAVGVPAGVAVVTAGVVAGLRHSPLAAMVTGYEGLGADPAGVALAEVVTGWYDLWAHPVTAALMIGAPVGAWLLRRRPWVAGMLLVVWALYLDAALGGPVGISGLWYTSTARLSVVAAMVTVPLGVVALLAGAGLVRRLVDRPGHLALRLAAAAVAVGLVGTMVVTSSVHTAGRTADVYGLAPGTHPRFVTAEEVTMQEEAGARLGGGAVLGNPFSGAPLLYSMYGVDVVFPVAGQVLTDEQEAVLAGFAEIAEGGAWDPTADSGLCDALDGLGVAYLYQDSEPYQVDHRYGVLDQVEVPGSQVIAEGGTARIVELPEC